MSSENFIFGESTEKLKLNESTTRQILGYDDDLMLVKIDFEAGAIGYVHQHEHTQCTYVVSGVFEFQVGNQTKTVKTGDGLYMEPNIPHGVKCIESGTLIDVFNPARKDFL